MVTYNKNDLTVLQGVVDEISGNGYDGDLNSIVNSFMEESSVDIEEAIKKGIAEYLCNFPEYMLYKTYRKLHIEYLVFNAPLEDMPLYMGYEGAEVLKKIVSKWRLMIGK